VEDYKMNNIAEQVMSVINQIAEKLGVAAEKLYPILRRQAMIDGIELSIELIILAIVCIITTKVAINSLKNPELTEPTREYSFEQLRKRWTPKQIISFWASAAISVVTCLIILTGLNTVITALLNPDWYIIQNILNQIIK
jgi:hypothetical protein